MSSGQIRLNTATGEWVIYAPARRKRPQELCQPPQPFPCITNACPFCDDPTRIEPIIFELPNADKTGWQTRVIPNKFPVLMPCGNSDRISEGFYISMQGYGKHEVIIEHPSHDQTPATMSIEEVKALIETYHQRYLDLMADPKIMLAIIFRNHKKEAGASQPHPHSQIIATSFVPRHRRWHEEEAQRYFDRWHRCVYCDMLRDELKEEKRIIEENDSFVAFVPYAAQVPCEVWIMPKQHKADFGSITEAEKGDFASILQRVLARLYKKLDNPAYNYVINSASRYKAEEPQLHWYCQILPRLTTPAGFELGAGISINPSIPEVDADFLRDCTL
ncbi:galactose-1-phosphate uridylyltransferase [Gloeothece citriformis PCC 7424]|uniref:Galactose-1-phosphate uridylyltransferase n=1 Tax=Gloeothece citriformis (strain PCC 7424) TaxID=65393 RepID=B7KAR3_GLOC7|nr:galactose-1-phosphate uridylyltransferase [Gloeothece citriformis]ACK68735.1 galactose-1-phosphate uridylyltransferase [Gloeothece citriformis PCC 7424]